MTLPSTPATVFGSSLDMRRTPPRPETLVPPDSVSVGAGTPICHPALDVFHSELLALIGDDAAGASVLTVVDEPQPGIALHAIGFLSVDGGSGRYVFAESGDPPASIFATSNEERMLDHIVSLLAAQAGSLAPRTLWGAISILVGQSIAQVERAMIMASSRHCAGDVGRTASVLGISVAELGEKLKRIRAGTPAPGERST